VSYHLRGGATYDSLTAAAKAVTEYASISGPRNVRFSSAV